MLDQPQIKTACSVDMHADRVSDTLILYQSSGAFRYGTDSALLFEYAKQRLTNRAKRGVDLCAGTGFLALSLCDAFPSLSVAAVEINATACCLSERSAAQSGLSRRFASVPCDVKQVAHHFAAESFDFAVSNPPYLTAACGKQCADEAMGIARHELLCTIDDVFKAAAYLLRTGGKFFLVYRVERLAALFAAANRSRFAIKSMQFVQTGKGSTASLVLCEAKKQAKEGLQVSWRNV